MGCSDITPACMYPGFTVVMRCYTSGTKGTGLHTDTLDLHCLGNAILPVAMTLACIHVSWIYTACVLLVVTTLTALAHDVQQFWLRLPRVMLYVASDGI